MTRKIRKSLLPTRGTAFITIALILIPLMWILIRDNVYGMAAGHIECVYSAIFLLPILTYIFYRVRKSDHKSLSQVFHSLLNNRVGYSFLGVFLIVEFLVSISWIGDVLYSILYSEPDFRNMVNLLFIEINTIVVLSTTGYLVSRFDTGPIDIAERDSLVTGISLPLTNRGIEVLIKPFGHYPNIRRVLIVSPQELSHFRADHLHTDGIIQRFAAGLYEEYKQLDSEIQSQEDDAQKQLMQSHILEILRQIIVKCVVGNYQSYKGLTTANVSWTRLQADYNEMRSCYKSLESELDTWQSEEVDRSVFNSTPGTSNISAAICLHSMLGERAYVAIHQKTGELAEYNLDYSMIGDRDSFIEKVSNVRSRQA